MQFFDHEALALHLARNGGLEIGSGTVGIDAEHGEELGPILVLLGKPILLGMDAVEKGILDLGCFQLEVSLEQVVSLGPIQQRDEKEKEGEKGRDREVHEHEFRKRGKGGQTRRRRKIRFRKCRCACQYALAQAWIWLHLKTDMKKFLTLSLLACLAGGTMIAQKAKKPARVGPMTPIEDVAGLPRILIVGDSISIGYTLPTRALLKGKANLHRIPTNGGPTTKGLAEIDKWLDKSKWDLIHFNWGLHDLKYMGPKGENLYPKEKGGKPQVAIEDYEKNLNKLVARMKKTGAKLVWRNTTPIPPGSKGRYVGDSVRYNEAAARVMKKHDVPTLDLFTPSKKNMKTWMRPANVHYFPRWLQSSGGTGCGRCAEEAGKVGPCQKGFGGR